MTASLMTKPVMTFTDSNGAPLSGGKVYFYAAGTSTPKNTYTDASGGTPNANPVVLDSSGSAVIFLSGTYKINLTDSAGVQQANYPVDNVSSFAIASNGTTVLDGSFTIQNSADNTKSVNFSASSVSAGTTTQVTVPDGNFTIQKKTSQLTDKTTISANDEFSISDSEASDASKKVKYQNLKAQLLSDGFLRGFISGCTISNNSGTPNTKVDIAAGSCVDSTNAILIKWAGFTLDFTVNGVNGLDAGSIATSTWYHIFLLVNSGGFSGCLASLSPNAPTVPVGYSFFRRVGSVKTDGSSHILAFHQYENEFYLNTPVLDYTGAGIGTAAQTVTLASVPTGVQVKAFFNVNVLDNGHNVYVSSLDVADVSPSVTAAPLAIAGGGASNAQESTSCWTNTSAQIRVRQDATTTTVRIATLGWKDLRL